MINMVYEHAILIYIFINFYIQISSICVLKYLNLYYTYILKTSESMHSHKGEIESIKTYILCIIDTIYTKMQTLIGMCAYISCSVPSYIYIHIDTYVHIFNNLYTGRVSPELQFFSPRLCLFI